MVNNVFTSAVVLVATLTAATAQAGLFVDIDYEGSCLGVTHIFEHEEDYRAFRRLCELAQKLRQDNLRDRRDLTDCRQARGDDHHRFSQAIESAQSCQRRLGQAEESARLNAEDARSCEWRITAAGEELDRRTQELNRRTFDLNHCREGFATARRGRQQDLSDYQEKICQLLPEFTFGEDPSADKEFFLSLEELVPCPE